MPPLRSTREIVVWSEVEEVLDKKRHHLLTVELPAAETMRDIGFQQGRLAVYNEMLTLPRALVVEAESALAEARGRLEIEQSQDARSWRHPAASERG